jgi:hypothetical protein
MNTTKVKIDGTEYDLDLEKAKSLGIIKESYVPKKIGQLFEISGQHSILAQSDDCLVCLICLESGNRWGDAVQVKDVRAITEKEWIRITASDSDSDYEGKFVKSEKTIKFE